MHLYSKKIFGFIISCIAGLIFAGLLLPDKNAAALVGEIEFQNYNHGYAEKEIVWQTSATSKNIITVAASKKPLVIGGGIGKPGPIASKTKIVDGKRVCKVKNDHPEKSGRNRPGHVDAECCLDPDETPNSNCYYPQARYAKMIQKYLSKQKK